MKHRHLDVFMYYLTRDVGASYFITELFRNNAIICSQIAEQHIQKIVNAIAEGFKQPQFVEMLEILCIVNKKPLRRNQTIVVKLLIEKQQETMVLFNDVETVQRRNQLIDIGDHEANENSLLNFHMKMIDLITKCARGRVYEAEIKAQSLYSLNDILTQLSDPKNLWDIKSLFVIFLQEVYFETEKKVTGLAVNRTVWNIISTIEKVATTEIEAAEGEQFKRINALFNRDAPPAPSSSSSHVVVDVAPCSSSSSSSSSTSTSPTSSSSSSSAITSNGTSGAVVIPTPHSRASTIDDEQLRVLAEKGMSALRKRGRILEPTPNTLSPVQHKRADRRDASPPPPPPLPSSRGTGTVAQRHRFLFQQAFTFLTSFFETHLQSEQVLSPTQLEICHQLMDALLRLFRCREYLSLEQRLIVGRLIKAMVARNISGQQQSGIDCKQVVQQYEQLAEEEELKRSTTLDEEVSKRVSHEDRVLCGLKLFCKAIPQQVDMSKELYKLARVLEGDLERFTRKLITVLRTHTSVPEDLALLSLRAIRQVLERDQENDTLREQMQMRMNDIGATELVLKLITNKSDAIVLEALKTGIALLHGGNLAVQTTIYRLFENSNGDEAFFCEIRSRIRRAIAEIKERQQFYARKAEKRKALQNDAIGALPSSSPSPSSPSTTTTSTTMMTSNSSSSNNMSSSNNAGTASTGGGGGGGGGISPRTLAVAATGGAMNLSSSAGSTNGLSGASTGSGGGGGGGSSGAAGAGSFDTKMLEILLDDDEEFKETGFIGEVLRFLQLLCEGHNDCLQNYLRSQTNNIKSYDLISETATFLEALYHEINPATIEVAVQCFESLTEFCQGPCHANQFALIRTKLCESAMYILHNNHGSADSDDEHYKEQVASLKESTLVTLLSLLEGISTPSIPRQMIATLDFKKMRENMEHENKDIGYLYFFLMSTLKDYDKDGELAELLQDCVEYDEGTGRIEIVRDNKLERIYFRIPRYVTCWRQRERERERERELHSRENLFVVQSMSQPHQELQGRLVGQRQARQPARQD